MRTIKLMADYQSFPLWEASPGQVGNIDPASLPISEELKNRLMQWASDFDATLNLDDPACSGFQNKEAITEFKRTGNKLGERLGKELGPDYSININV